MDDSLMEPGRAYREKYKDLFRKNAEELLDSLVQQSGLNVEENHTTVNAYREAEKKRKETTRKLRGKKVLKVILIVLAVVSGILAVAGGFLQKWILMAVCIALCPAFILLAVLVLTPQIKKAQAEKQVYEEESAKRLAEANEQMRPLLALFDNAMPMELVHKTVPLLETDPNFSVKALDYLAGKYGFSEDYGDEVSTTGILSGRILGNPFIVQRVLRHRMGTQKYTGTLVIHWTETYRDSNGRLSTRTRTQTLHASITRPKPFYNSETRLVYGNDAAPDLSFSHEPSHAERMSEKALKRYVESGAKKIRKQAAKNMSSGFTEMGNEEFDVLFGATDRDNEVQFRLLFTPLAQKNELSLMKGESPFGDDFRMSKKKCLNYIQSEHAQRWEMDFSKEVYYSYDIETCRAQFLKFNTENFEHLYFDLAPLLAIPLYQQNKPREYIYQTEYERNYTSSEGEILCNRFPGKELQHKDAATPSIFKTSLSQKNGNEDTIEVRALAYRGIPRITYVPVHGGDGRMHNVPVEWTEYRPICRTNFLQVKELGLNDRGYQDSSYFKEEQPHVYCHSLFARLFDDQPMEEDLPVDDIPDLLDDDVNGAEQEDND